MIQGNPFSSKQFFNALSKSGSIGKEKGWDPLTIKSDESEFTTFIKTHSYGEYIFDWNWAEAYERYGLPYYPKLTSMAPFTPATIKHFEDYSLLKKHDEYLKEGPYSSAHFLFLEKEEVPHFSEQNYLLRETLQYHFYNNDYSSFDHFLHSLKSKKAKNLRKERTFLDIKFKRYTGQELKPEHAQRMYQFYISTIAQKNSFDYLNLSFFEEAFQTMKDNILYVEASKDHEVLGASLFFFGGGKLYGRYWGAIEFIQNLHFELCYYQGIDFCIEKNLSVFEAGAQGEHKITRGFRPTIIHSAHKIKHQAFHEAIKQFIEKEKEFTEITRKQLSELLPFKK